MNIELQDTLTQFFAAVGAIAAAQIDVFQLQTSGELLDYWQCMEWLEQWKETHE